MTHTHTKTPAQWYALIVGSVLLLAGLLGFVYSTSFAIGNDTPREAILGILDVNGWHNMVHLLTGLAGVLVMKSAHNSYLYALILGVVYLLVAAWGFAIGNGTILGLVPVNMADNFLHLALGAAGVAAALASKKHAHAHGTAHAA